MKYCFCSRSNDDEKRERCSQNRRAIGCSIDRKEDCGRLKKRVLLTYFVNERKGRVSDDDEGWSVGVKKGWKKTKRRECKKKGRRKN